MENRIIGHLECPRCLGQGHIDEWLAPFGCVPGCAADLEPYDYQGRFKGGLGRLLNPGLWICKKHGMILWTSDQRQRCLKGETSPAPNFPKGGRHV